MHAFMQDVRPGAIAAEQLERQGAVGLGALDHGPAVHQWVEDRVHRLVLDQADVRLDRRARRRVGEGADAGP